LDKVLEKYSKREVSLGRVAETAKIPLVFRTKNHPFSLPKPIIQKRGFFGQSCRNGKNSTSI